MEMILNVQLVSFVRTHELTTQVNILRTSYLMHVQQVRIEKQKVVQSSITIILRLSLVMTLLQLVQLQHALSVTQAMVVLSPELTISIANVVLVTIVFLDLRQLLH